MKKSCDECNTKQNCVFVILLMYGKKKQSYDFSNEMYQILKESKPARDVYNKLIIGNPQLV